MSSSKAAVKAKPAPAKKAAAKKTSAKRKLAAVELVAAPQPAAPAASVGPQMTETAVLIEKALRAGDLSAIPAEPLQQILAAAAKAYSAKREAGEQFHPVSRAGRLTPTDIMVTANGLLRSGNLQIFELGMWQSWTGD
jgi:hypothetical protein